MERDLHILSALSNALHLGEVRDTLAFWGFISSQCCDISALFATGLHKNLCMHDSGKYGC